MQIPTSQAGSAASTRRLATVMPVYLATICFSAFLLFGIQPMFAKMVLPRLGGSPGVWSVAMVFFQTVLLLGYGYAHWLVSRFSVRRAALIHILVMGLVLLVASPIAIAPGFERPPQDGEMLWLIALFAASVGLPFFAVSANGPLLQAWFARTGHPHAADPYFLYAASNIGSFVALLAYPLAIEPFLRLQSQTMSWAWGFGFLLAGIAACAGLSVGPGRDEAPQARALAPSPVSAARKLSWLGFAFLPSALLVAVTAHISTDVAAAPLLWVAPLALFLLTFVIVFQRNPLLRHRWMLHFQLVMVVATIASHAASVSLGWAYYFVLHLMLFFATAMVAHGELARRRPEAANLTSFYLWMSAGGVLGGLFSGLLAPMLFNSVVEYPLLVLAGLLCRPGLNPRKLSPSIQVILAGMAIVVFAGLVVSEARRTDSVRSFFGVNRIVETDDGRFRMLLHGTTIHGAQRLRDDAGKLVGEPPEPLTYYYTGGAIADGIASVRQARDGKLGAVAAVGLGTGSLACQARADENWTFYEIDREVIRIATDTSRFTFLSSCQARPKIVLGDARLMLAEAQNGSLDLIVVDAFSSDAIPVHLMTVEAVDLYRQKLKPDGVLLMHISNRNMELGEIVTAIASQRGLSTWIRNSDAKPFSTEDWKVSPRVAMVARQADDVGPLATDGRWVRHSGANSGTPWTDDYANIVGAIWKHWKR